MSIAELIENLKHPAQTGWAREKARSMGLSAKLSRAEKELLQGSLDASPPPIKPVKPW